MKNFTKVFFVIITIVIFIFLIFYFGNQLFYIPLAKPQQEVCYKNYCFNVEIAKTQQELSKGLMFRKNLEKNNGMLFVFEKEGDYPFWMKNTLIPLDIIWMDKNNKVVFINENSQPCEPSFCPSIDPKVSAKYVLEINAGMVKEIGLKVSDKLNRY